MRSTLVMCLVAVLLVVCLKAADANQNRNSRNNNRNSQNRNSNSRNSQTRNNQNRNSQTSRIIQNRNSQNRRFRPGSSSRSRSAERAYHKYINDVCIDECDCEDKTWLFAIAVSNFLRPYMYLDDTGALVGWTLDLVKAVCAIAGKNCEFVRLAVSACGQTGSGGEWLPGDALMDGWFDSCIYWLMTTERTNSITFTHPYREGLPVYFYVTSATCPDPDNLIGVTLALRNGVFTNEACLNLGEATGATIELYDTMDLAIQAVIDGNADALFAWIPEPADLTRCTALSFRCDLGGTSQMVKKGSCLPQWWNQAFKTLVDCGCYDAMCATAMADHGEITNCFQNLPRDSCPLGACPEV